MKCSGDKQLIEKAEHINKNAALKDLRCPVFNKMTTVESERFLNRTEYPMHDHKEMLNTSDFEQMFCLIGDIDNILQRRKMLTKFAPIATSEINPTVENRERMTTEFNETSVTAKTSTATISQANTSDPANVTSTEHHSITTNPTTAIIDETEFDSSSGDDEECLDDDFDSLEDESEISQEVSTVNTTGTVNTNRSTEHENQLYKYDCTINSVMNTIKTNFNHTLLTEVGYCIVIILVS